MVFLPCAASAGVNHCLFGPSNATAECSYSSIRGANVTTANIGVLKGHITRIARTHSQSRSWSALSTRVAILSSPREHYTQVYRRYLRMNWKFSRTVPAHLVCGKDCKRAMTQTGKRISICKHSADFLFFMTCKPRLGLKSGFHGNGRAIQHDHLRRFRQRSTFRST